MLLLSLLGKPTTKTFLRLIRNSTAGKTCKRCKHVCAIFSLFCCANCLGIVHILRVLNHLVKQQNAIKSVSSFRVQIKKRRDVLFRCNFKYQFRVCLYYFCTPFPSMRNNALHWVVGHKVCFIRIFGNKKNFPLWDG